jgi:signal transduction histidine kinase
MIHPAPQESQSTEPPGSASLAGHEAARDPHLAGAPYSAKHRGHVVQFYDDSGVLVSDVADFVEAGLAEGLPVIAIVDDHRRGALEGELKRRGVDAALVEDGRIVLADARDTLAAFMDGGMPDGCRFQTLLGGMIDASLAASRHTSVRLYGEMVDLLWKDGNPEAAIRLEELWNGLAASRSFSLLCAYEMSNFRRETDSDAFRRICGQHERVVPTESYTEVDGAARMLEISLLQQRARALENEIEQRKELEWQLRRALAERGHAEEKARAASLAKSEFLAVMSHELRTPLNAIGGHLQLVEMELHGPVTQAQRDAIARAQANQRHLLALINDVLNLVRIETGRLEYVLEPIELRPLLNELVAMIEPLLQQKRLACAISSPPGAYGAAPAVYADREKFQQIMLNLLTNAIKFTPATGRIDIIVDDSQDSDLVRLEVRDTGIGIPSAKLEQVFDPFVQAAPRPSGQHDGVGLGLAISRDLARGMGGDISAESVVGEGTCMTLTLPASV